MGFNALLHQTCDLKRNTSANDGPYGTVTMTTQASGVKCRLEMMSGKELEGGAQAMIGTHRLFLPKGTTIAPEWTATVSGADYEITVVDDMPGGTTHHIECLCKRVS